MSPLEELAAQFFERFAMLETGKPANWDYLSKERKLEWIKDIMLIADSVLDSLRSGIKPVNSLPPNNASYTVGYYAGIRSERVNLAAYLEKFHKDWQDDFLKLTE